MDELFEQDLKRLKTFTKDCRDSMHEPDEQGIYAEFGPNTYKFIGFPDHVARTTFDNANTGEMSYDMGFWLIKRVYDEDDKRHELQTYTEVREWFNLAVIVALARMAKE